jgi:glutamate-ammonia-ligase adenylyltransferase
MARPGSNPAISPEALRGQLGDAYPALISAMEAHPEDVVAIARGARQPRDARAYRRLLASVVAELSDPVAVRKGLRRFAAREKMRVATRELLAFPGHDVDVTARELSDMADVCCEVALAEALGWAEARYGVPMTAAGEPCALVVLGMGKLGGRELNAGSDIDLLLFYQTDDGETRGRLGQSGGLSLHEHFTRVAQRFIATLDEPTEDGIVWRVDLRLRPEGTRGPLVNALAAAERYYETWGRTWERAALVRARPVAGDLRLGARLLEALAPFVWRRAVDPTIAQEMASMLARARAEAGASARDDLKIGPGGIRDVEFFTQSLQLVWGGREPRVRGTNTLDALRRLRSRGFVSDREQGELSDAYLFLRRLEHRVQFATGTQTHTLPSSADLRARIAHSLGYESAETMAKEVVAVRARVAARFASLGREAPSDVSLDRLWAALDGRDLEAVAEAAQARFGALGASDLPRHLLVLSRRTDDPLGSATREREPVFARFLIEALADAADPEQSARLLAAFFSRLATPGVYVRPLAEEPRTVRSICTLLGASAFLGEALILHPDLVDRVVYAHSLPTPEVARAQLNEEVMALRPEEARDVDAFVGALRRAKRRVTFEVGLADLADELTTRETGHALAALADATLEQVCQFVMSEASQGARGAPGSLALLGMGKLGGREIGYGSDLDIVFVYDGTSAASPRRGQNLDARDEDAPERFARIAQRVLRLVGSPHWAGVGYELDTRLRPSGNQGLLVVPIEAFARYHAERAEGWERQALVKARVCAGDPALGAHVLDIAHAAAYERGAPPPEEVNRLRVRMERELARERRERSPARYDVKLGLGGTVDIEFAVQWLQMRHGGDRRVRTTETEVALTALETCRYLEPALADALRDGWRFLRRLEQRLRVSHGKSAALLEQGAPGLAAVARAMGFRDAPRTRAEEALLARYVSITRDVRAAYLRVLGLDD